VIHGPSALINNMTDVSADTEIRLALSEVAAYLPDEVVDYIVETIAAENDPSITYGTADAVEEAFAEWLVVDSIVDREEAKFAAEQLFGELTARGVIRGTAEVTTKKSRTDSQTSDSDSDAEGGNAEGSEITPSAGALILDEEIMLDDGQCLLCERIMPLTAHHLTPKETHRKYAKRGFSKDFLNTCIMICRPCHSAIHRFIDNETLASSYNTMDKLLTHEKVQRWIPYIAKQKTTTKADALNPKLRYRR
jgi:hypothetical protein